MKQGILLILVCFLAGCLSKRAGWQDVRIVKSLPSEQCKYLAQDTCSRTGDICHKWLKKRAKERGGDTVIFTDSLVSQEGSSQSFIFKDGGGSSSKSGVAFTIIAEYFQCH